MKLSEIVEHLKKHTPSLEGRVAGGIGFDPDTFTVNLPMPSAYVMYSDDDAGEQLADSSYRQEITDKFSVLVFMRSDPMRFQVSPEIVDRLHVVRKELLRALAGFVFDEEYDPVEYRGSQLIYVNKGITAHQFEFEAVFQIGGSDKYRDSYGNASEKEQYDSCETWDEVSKIGLQDFKGVDLRVDSIDVFDRSLVSSGPDGVIDIGGEITYEPKNLRNPC